MENFQYISAKIKRSYLFHSIYLLEKIQNQFDPKLSTSTEKDDANKKLHANKYLCHNLNR
jgi:hypothetical protein